MHIYNTLTGEKELLEQPKRGPLRLFVCGPTVDGRAHFGHARTYLAFDLFVRFLRKKVGKVLYIQNITDVDNKIIDRARNEQKDPLLFAQSYMRLYFKDMRRLGVNSINHYARATRFIPQIVAQVELLRTRGYAYYIPGSGFYFDIMQFPDYGKLSKRTALQAEDSVSRIDESLKKKNKGDFVLWKEVNVCSVTPSPKKKFVLVDGEPAWYTSLGWGRPGWHIEDTAISEHFFGPQYDIHGGGDDLKFPHHEAEIAQQESASGKSPFVKVWMHTGLIRIDDVKMSKSIGNVITIDDFLKNHSPSLLRWIVFAHHYRSPINYTRDVLENASRSLHTLRTTLEKINFALNHSPRAKKDSSLSTITIATQKNFYESLEDDFNTPRAAGILLSYLKDIDTALWSSSPKTLKDARILIREILSLFGFSLPPSSIPKKMRNLLAERELCRSRKQFMQADTLRKEILGLGYVVEDTPCGPFITKAMFE